MFNKRRERPRWSTNKTTQVHIQTRPDWHSHFLDISLSKFRLRCNWIVSALQYCFLVKGRRRDMSANKLLLRVTSNMLYLSWLHIKLWQKTSDKTRKCTMIFLEIAASFNLFQYAIHISTQNNVLESAQTPLMVSSIPRRHHTGFVTRYSLCKR